MTDKLRIVEGVLGRHMDEIRGLFVRPDDVKVTVILRVPWLSDADVVQTNEDDVEDAIAAVRALYATPEPSTPHTGED